MHSRAFASVLVIFGAVSLGCSSKNGAVAESNDAGPDPDSFSTPPESCAYTCPNSSCSEATTPYVCPSLGAWTTVPHADTCPAWDGTYPAVTPGRCTASTPGADAIVPAQKAGTPIVLPDGRRITPAGSDWLFDEADVPESLPVSTLLVPGTSLALVVDVGYQTNALRAVDLTKIGSATNPTVSYITFPNPSLLNRGIALVAPNHVYVATDDGIVQAFSIDLTAGTLAKDDTRDLALPSSINDESKTANFYVEGVAASPDGTKLVVTSVFDPRLLVFDVDETSATRGKQLGEVSLGTAQTFGAWFDPNDATGTMVYVSSIQGQSVLEVDVSTPAAPVVKKAIKTPEGPQGIAFLDARFMAVADDMADSISIVDRMTSTVTSVAVGTDGLTGLEPSTLAYDAASSTLYATLAGANAIGAWTVDHTSQPPSLTPAGKLGTAWWPTDVAVGSDGSLVVTALKGHGAGPYLEALPPDNGDGMAGSGGGIQMIPTPTAALLTAGEAQVAANDRVGALPGTPTVQCPSGAADFPVPATNTVGASALIQHVILVVRENKAFDAIFGDFPTVNGDAALTAKATTAELDTLWKNERALARAFAISDNYYTDAEISVQGHYWTTFGRTSDFTERTWFEAGGYSRNAAIGPLPIPGTASYSQPPYGSLFDWLSTNHIQYDILGEGDGTLSPIAGHVYPVDTSYPGGFIQDIGYPDNEKACYVAARARVRCDIGQLTYMTLPNDHCNGTDPSTPSPETMIATNDEATGMLVDGLSHSPLWASTLVIVIEDDPQQGGDHVDKHRSPMLVASPWVKRGYVSPTHIDVASLDKVIANVLGIPYPNEIVANASLPFDLFTSTPDYTPYSYAPRAVPLTCGVDATRDEVRASQRWDFSHVDSQPGFDAAIARWLRGHDLAGRVKREVVAP